MWGRPIAQQYADVAEFVGLCDINPLRVEVAKKQMGVSCPTFTDFDQMIDKAKPDLLMVTTVDGYHSEYIVRALERGVDVMTEKPMAIDETQCQAVLDAEKKSGSKIIVTFNYRYAPKHQTIKELLMSGAIGKSHRVDFSWFLDTRHGADYFRRWHRLRSKSGSLWVHKATPPLRSGQLVARRGSGPGLGLWQPAELRQERPVPAHDVPRLPTPVQVPLLLGHHQGQEPHRSLCEVRVC